MSNEEWRQRPTYSRTLTYFECCKTLREDVETRRQYWPSVNLLSCLDCYRKAVADASGVAVC